MYTSIEFQLTSPISDTETLSQIWPSVAGIAWLSFQIKLNGILCNQTLSIILEVNADTYLTLETKRQFLPSFLSTFSYH